MHTGYVSESDVSIEGATRTRRRKLISVFIGGRAVMRYLVRLKDRSCHLQVPGTDTKRISSVLTRCRDRFHAMPLNWPIE
jgi:hypothetical protein